MILPFSNICQVPRLCFKHSPRDLVVNVNESCLISLLLKIPVIKMTIEAVAHIKNFVSHDAAQA